MIALKKAFDEFLRGPRVSGWLVKAGIDPKRYWLLSDLFSLLSERGEMADQLGRGGIALEMAVKVYCGLSALFTVMMVLTHSTPAAYLAFFLVFTTFLLFSVLLSEAANSLVNPAEGLILVHQPIDGATYSAAKLSHLARIVLSLVPALNGIPAAGGLLLRGAGWSYPLLHLAVAFLLGLIEALLCCAIFGWLVRFVPVRRLKMAGLLASGIPFMVMPWMDVVQRSVAHLQIQAWLPAQPALRWTFFAAIVIAAAAAVVFGIRSLSADYLLRVSGLMHGGAQRRKGGPRRPRSLLGTIVSRFFGGPPGRAGFAFVSRMMLRDWQFRRMALSMIIPVVFGIGAIVKQGWPHDPFVRHFTPIHLLPHVLATLLFLACTALPYGNDYKGAWIFLLAPSRAIDGFAWGVYAMLWMTVIVIPLLLLLPLFAWLWGIPHALLFVLYSVAVASAYLTIELRLVEEIPFSKQADPSRGTSLLAWMILGGIVISIAVGLQYLFVFQSFSLAAMTTAVIAIAAWFLTRISVGAMGASMRYHLGQEAAPSESLYKEVGA